MDFLCPTVAFLRIQYNVLVVVGYEQLCTTENLFVVGKDQAYNRYMHSCLDRLFESFLKFYDELSAKFLDSVQQCHLIIPITCFQNLSSVYNMLNT